MYFTKHCSVFMNELSTGFNKRLRDSKNTTFRFICFEIENLKSKLRQGTTFELRVVTVHSTGKSIVARLMGKSLSKALLFAEHGKNMLCTKIVLNVRNNFCKKHVFPRFELGIFMY